MFVHNRQNFYLPSPERYYGGLLFDGGYFLCDSKEKLSKKIIFFRGGAFRFKHSDPGEIKKKNTKNVY